MAKRCSSTVMPGCLRDRLDERPFDLGARQVLVVEDAVLGWPPSRFSSKRPSGVLSKRVPHSIRSRISSGARRTTSPTASSSHLPAPQTSVSRMCFSKVSGGVGYRADAALRIVGVALVHFALRHDGDVSVGSGFERERKARRAGTDNQKVGFHSFASVKRRKVIKMPDNPIFGRKKRTEKWGNGSGTDPRSGNFFRPGRRYLEFFSIFALSYPK